MFNFFVKSADVKELLLKMSADVKECRCKRIIVENE
jgi:hypothetical protein